MQSGRFPQPKSARVDYAAMGIGAMAYLDVNENPRNEVLRTANNARAVRDGVGVAFGHDAPLPQTGFTSPGLIYVEMRQINDSALSLAKDIALNVTDSLTMSAWNAWLTDWSGFYQEQMKLLSKVGAVFTSDDLAAKVDTYRQQLLTWYATYTAKTGGKVPTSPAVPDPVAPGDQGSVGIPWWAISLATIAALGAAYWGYCQVRNAWHMKKTLDEKFFHPAGEHMMDSMSEAVAHDPPIVVTHTPDPPVHVAAPCGHVHTAPSYPHPHYGGY